MADAPQAFRFDDDEIAEPTMPSPPIPESRLLDVARTCPSGAITVYREDLRELDLD